MVYSAQPLVSGPEREEGEGTVWSTMSDTHTYSSSDMCGPPATTVGWMDPGKQTLRFGGGGG